MIIGHSDTYVTFDVPEGTNLPDLKDDFLDYFRESVDLRVYRFSDADVDWAVANGGYVELPRQQVLNRIIDRRLP